MLVYKLNRKYIISKYILQLVFLTYLSYDAYSDIKDGVKSLSDFDVLFLYILVCLFFLIKALTKKVIIDNNTLCVKDIFTKKEVTVDEMEGYEVDKSNIVIDLIDDPKKKIKISVHFDGKDEIIDWLWEKMTDPEQEMEEEAVEDEDAAEDEVESEFELSEEMEVYESIGDTDELRAIEFNKTKRYVWYMNLASCLIAAWLFFYPEPYKYSMLTALAMPIGLLAFLKLNRGLITVDDNEKSVFPSFIPSFVFLSLPLAFRGLLAYNILDYYQLFTSTLIGSAIVSLLVFSKPNEFISSRKAKLESLKVLIPFILAYSLGAVAFINCNYDNTASENYKVKILSKRISSSKSTTTYYIEITAWGKLTGSDEIDVGRQRYHKVNIGDSVSIDVYNGLLGVPWYDVTYEK